MPALSWVPVNQARSQSVQTAEEASRAEEKATMMCFGLAQSASAPDGASTGAQV